MIATELPPNTEYLTVIRDTGKRTKAGGVIVECVCKCGNTKEIAAASIRRGLTISCGCYGRERRRAGRMSSTRKLTPAQKAEVCEMYVKSPHVTQTEIAEHFNVDRTSVGDILKARGVVRNTVTDIHRYLSGRMLDEGCFASTSPDSSYWAGFLMADGNVLDDGTIQLRLHKKDAEHLRKFRRFTGSTHDIQEYGDMCAIAFRSQRVANDLAKLNVVPRKSLTAAACGALEGNRDFWRGVIDGDGYISKPGTVKSRLELCGSKRLVTQFRGFVVSHGGSNRPSVHRTESIFRIQYSGLSVRTLVAVLYEDSATYLDRKYKAALAVL